MSENMVEMPVIPSHIKGEFEAVLTWFSQAGARNLSDQLICIAMVDMAMNDEIRYGVAVKMDEKSIIPLFFLGIGGWHPHMVEDADGKEQAITYSIRPRATADEIIAAIPDDALASFEDEDTLCTEDDIDDDAWE